MCSLLLLADFTGVLHAWLGWIAHVQLVPAVLAGMVGIVAAVFVLTFLFGRVYCSVLCPLGIVQDGVMSFSGKKYSFKKECRLSRYGVLAAFVLLLVFGLTAVASLVEPWGIFGKITSNVFTPIYRLGNNGLAWMAERWDSYAFYEAEVWTGSFLTLVFALALLVIISVLAYRRGRVWCNSICPVGTTLGLVSRFSVFGIRIDKSKCTQCGVCEKRCKGECIDSKREYVDRSRCVACFDCLGACNFGALKYSVCKKPTSAGSRNARPEGGRAALSKERRNFLAISGLFLVGVAKAQSPAPLLKVDGGLADIVDKKRPERKVPVVPPGARGARNVASKCVTCGLCISSCPNRVLVPSSKLATLMQPEMTFERGYCRPECVECGAVCPSGAIKHIDAAEKTAISIGTAVWVADNCVVNRDELPCTACERHCPTKAITLVARSEGDKLRVPVVDKTKCTGCGACENLCPARPYAAIFVEGNQEHHSL